MLVSILARNAICSALCAASIALIGAQAEASGERVILLNDSFPGSSDSWRRALSGELKSSGFDVHETDGESLAAGLDSVIYSGATLVLPDARYFPAEATESLRAFLGRGNHLFALSGPVMSRLVSKKDGAWVDAGLDAKPLLLESLSPAYKTYTTSAPYIGLTESGDRVSCSGGTCLSLYRSSGYLCDSLRRLRQAPFAYALDKDGNRLGVAGHILYNSSGAYSRSRWGYLGIDQADLEAGAARYAPLVAAQLHRIYRGLYLANAGTDAFAYAEGEKPRFGAYVGNATCGDVELRLEFAVLSGAKTLRATTVKAAVPSSSFDVATFVSGGRLTLEPGEYTLRTRLIVGGERIDEVSQRFQVIRYGKLSADDVVTVKDGEFQLGGKPWSAVGVNYWPVYASGLEPEDYWLQQWTPCFYDPEVVDSELAQIKRLGFTSISTQYNRLNQARCVMDLLARAQKYGLKAHIYVPGLTGRVRTEFSYTDQATAHSMIEAAHLPESPAVFAYDLDWEAHIGPRASRVAYDGIWQEWAIDQYGSVEAAEREWGYTPESTDGVIVGPSDEQLSKDGPWNVYVAAYRRFIDDEVSRGYGATRRALKAVDPHHLMGVRSGYGGIGTGAMFWVGVIPFDLRSGARHLDFISPEEYNIPGGQLDFLRVGAVAAYAKLVSGGKPVYWAEYGIPLFNGLDALKYRTENSMQSWERQREYTKKMVTAVRTTGANGCSAWWWPGGYRLVEASDFGLTCPDGAPRPAAYEPARAWRSVEPVRTAPTAETTFVVDRDAHAYGFADIYNSLAETCAKLYAEGKTPTFTTAGVGTTSADTPLACVGNIPYKGVGPLKYLNAELEVVKVNGRIAADGETLHVRSGKAITVEAAVGNTAEAEWIAGGTSTGAVCLQADLMGKKTLAPIRANVGFLAGTEILAFTVGRMGDSAATLVIRMTAVGRAEFGQTIRVKIEP